MWIVDERLRPKEESNQTTVRNKEQINAANRSLLLRRADLPGIEWQPVSLLTNEDSVYFNSLWIMLFKVLGLVELKLHIKENVKP